jgi:hypothetical protein
MRIFKWTIVVVFAIFILIQFYPKKLPQSEKKEGETFLSRAAVPTQVGNILKISCFDCHSNHINYPWYSHIAPVSWLVTSDVKEGQKKLNFTTWENYTPTRQIRKLEDIKEHIADGEMPLPLYTLIHRQARLNTQQKAIIAAWCDSMSNELMKD